MWSQKEKKNKAIVPTLQSQACTGTMGKLNIAHHKSYHPYRRDNIEKVRRDEEEARQKEAQEEGRMQLAVCYSSQFPSNELYPDVINRTLKHG